jgi:hypothetical protein
LNAERTEALWASFTATGLDLGGRLSFSANGTFTAGGRCFYKDATYGLVIGAASGSNYDFLLTTPSGATTSFGFGWQHNRQFPCRQD